MNKHRLLWIIPLGLSFFLTSPAFGKRIVFHGIPVIQNRSSADLSHNVKLDNNQKITNAAIITEEDGKYFWATRDKRELLYQSMNNFDLFIDLKTGGYIKIITKGGKFGYMEHIAIPGMKAFTYWGNILAYNPKDLK
ncbi:MAG: hypothetical protein ABGX83_08870 [Nitrospira sp.]|nr:hypothetical protein [Candidatus Manganitrophaceae bacterium]HIL33972.1 hypothetical protein [Candidatus Manganitrophaceae bacterium]